MFNKPSRFYGDPEGWVANQTGHMRAGLAWVFWACFGYFIIFEEFPVRWHIFIAIGITYLGFELIKQGWKGWDTIEDWWFVVLYGAGAPLAVFREFELGSGMFYGQIWEIVPFAIVSVLHLTLGIGVRWLQKQSIKRGARNES